MSCRSLCNDLQELSITDPTPLLRIPSHTNHENSGCDNSEIQKQLLLRQVLRIITSTSVTLSQVAALVILPALDLFSYSYNVPDRSVLFNLFKANCLRHAPTV